MIHGVAGDARARIVGAGAFGHNLAVPVLLMELVPQ